MSEAMKIVLTAGLTFVAGVVLFIVGEFTKVLVIVPLQKFKEQVQLTLDRVDFYANRMTNFFDDYPTPDEWKLMEQVSADFRSAATQLTSKYAGIGGRKVLIFCRIIPPKGNINTAYKSLIFLSNNLPRQGDSRAIDLNYDEIQKVKSALMDR